MKLSILIPSIPERFNKSKRLIHKLESIFEGRDVEILMLCDNKKMSIGAKRNKLKDICAGDYFAFCDDDDMVNDKYVRLVEATENGSDVITFKQRAVIDYVESVIDFDLTHEENEDWIPQTTIKRQPFHVCAWRRELFQNILFSNSNYGEDWDFCKEALKIAKTQTKIDEVIHIYNFNSELTMAK